MVRPTTKKVTFTSHVTKFSGALEKAKKLNVSAESARNHRRETCILSPADVDGD